MAMLYVNDESTIDTVGTFSGDETTSEAQITLSAFWPSVLDEVKKIKNVDAKNQVLPLARIKKIMKLDEDVKMISAEAPLLFAKASEIFIHELTLRAWVHTEDNKRRTLQKNDIAMAITKYDQFDFLIDIVPRDEIKPVKKEPETKAVINCDQVFDNGQYYFQIAQQTLQGSTTPQQQQQQNQNQQNQQQQTNQLTGQTLQLQTQSSPVSVNCSPQNILLTNPTTNQTTQMVVQQQQQQQQQQQHQQQSQQQSLQQQQAQTPQGQQQQQQHIQIVQQIVTPSGEIQNVPIPLTQSQLNLLRMQLQNGTNQQLIIQSPMQTQTQSQVLQVGQNNSSGIYLNTSQTSSTDD